MIPQWSFFARIVLAFVFSSFLGIILVAAFINNKLTTSAIEQWGYKHQSIAHSIAENIEEELIHARMRLEETAALPAFSSLPYADQIDATLNGLPEGIDPEKRQILEKLIKGPKEFSVAFALLPNGDHYISHPFSVQKSLREYNLSHRPYFKEASKTKKPVLSDAIPGADGVPAIAIDIPLLSRKGEIYGHLGGVLHLSQLNSLVNNSVEASLDQWVLLGKNQKVISNWSAKQSKVDQRIKLINQSLSQLEKDSDGKPHAALAKDSGFRTIEADGEELVFNLTILKSGWKLVLMRDIASIEALVLPDVIETTFLIATILLLLSAIGIVVVARTGQKWEDAEKKVYEINKNLEELVFAQNSSLKEGEQRYHALLDSVEVSILEEDFSDVFKELTALKEKGITDIRAYFSNNIDHAWRLASVVKIININEETVELFGAPDKKTLMGSIDQVFADTSIFQFIDELCAFWNQDETYRAESVRRKLDGSEITIIHSMPIPKTLEEAKSVPISLLDITELKSNEKAMVRANRGLQLLSDCSTTVNRAKNEQFLIDEICNKIVTDGGYPLAWVGFVDVNLSKNISLIASAGSGGEYLKTLSFTLKDHNHEQGPTCKAILQGVPFVINNLQEDPESSSWKTQAAVHGYNSAIAFPLKPESGKTLGALTIYANPIDAFDDKEISLLTNLAETLAFGIWDLRTEKAQKEAEKKLRDSEARFRSISSSSSIAMILATDDEGFIISWNPAAERTFGYTEKEIIGRHLTKLMPERYRQNHNKGFERAVKEQTYKMIGKTVELAALHKNGHEFPIELSLGRWEEEGKIYFSGVIHDISDRKQMEQNLVVAQKMESVGQLSGGIAHDFNNLLGIIQGNLELIKALAKDNETITKRVEPALRATKRGADLTSRLLGFSRRKAQDSHATSLNEVILRTNPLVEKSLTSLIEIKFDLSENLWLTDIDSGDFENAIINLAINARDAMKGTGVLSFRTENTHLSQQEADLIPMANSGDYVAVSVSDNGSGMPPEVRDRVFEPFFSTKEESKGTGLGLSMVYGFVQRSGGFVDLTSEEGQGTTFKIFLPKSTKTQIKTNTQHDSKVTDILPQGSETILVVDDEEDLLDITVNELKEFGYKVLSANSPEKALEVLQKNRQIDLMLSDIVMPGVMDGYELASHVIRHWPNIRVMLMSGYTSRTEETQKRTDPILDYLLDHLLSKPFTKETLAQQVRKTLDSNISIPWREEFAVGITEIDEDHRVLISLLNRLFASVENNKNNNQIRHVIEGVVDYSAYHFVREETLMKVCGYPHLENHKKVHEMMSEKVKRLASQVEQRNDPELLGELVQYLMSWLIDHIQAMDRSIKPFTVGKIEDIKLALANIERPVKL